MLSELLFLATVAKSVALGTAKAGKFTRLPRYLFYFLCQFTPSCINDWGF